MSDNGNTLRIVHLLIFESTFFMNDQYCFRDSCVQKCDIVSVLVATRLIKSTY